MLNVGIIGCGAIARQRHAAEYKNNANTTIAGVFDVSRERAQAMANDFGGKVYDTAEAMIADTSKSLAEELGILNEGEKVAYRATFIIDPEGIVRWVNINDLNVGRNVAEVLRVLDALQTDELCPCNWTKGEETLTQAKQKAEAVA